jgi:hypothetical protein
MQLVSSFGILAALLLLGSEANAQSADTVLQLPPDATAVAPATATPRRTYGFRRVADYGGPARVSCAKWLEVRPGANKLDAATSLGLITWVEGYLTATQFYETDDSLPAMPGGPQEAMKWIDNYCRERIDQSTPSTLGDAVQAYVASYWDR